MNQDTPPKKVEHDEVYVSRSVKHPKQPLRLRDILHWLFGSLQLAPRQSRVRVSHTVVVKRPAQLPQTSRFRARRRARRLRRAYRLRFIMWTKRIVFSCMIVMSVAMLLFWAKFAIVYHLPPYLQQGPLQGAQAYVVFKSWWFGPPSFDLADYPNVNLTNPIHSLAMQLEKYQDIVTNPREIVLVIVRNTNVYLRK